MLTRTLIIAMILVLVLFAGGVQAGGDAARGKAMSEDCTMCHGDDGLGDEDIPAIAGMDAAEHVKALNDFKTGARPDEEENMTDAVADLSEQDMADLAAYFSSLPGK